MATLKKTSAKTGLLERLQKGVVLGAEGYLFELERRGLVKAGAYVPEVVLDNPEAVKELHREFLHAGAEVMVAFTYYAHRDKLRLIGREGDLEPLNMTALRLAKEVAAEGEDVLVAGNICNTWVYDVNDKVRTAKIVREMYEEQIGWAAKAGVDLIIAETLTYLEEALIALDVIKKYNLPSVITFATLNTEKSQDGYDWIEACKMLEAKGADVVGFNCTQGPTTLMPLMKKLRSSVKCHVACQPVPFNTTAQCHSFQKLVNRDGRNAFPIALEEHLLTRFHLADFARQAKEIGVNYIGICCGGAPYHVREMAEALGRTVPASKYSADLNGHFCFNVNRIILFNIYY
ncbi:homocysteine s-methyltransferase domain-containing protein [Ditylenchus destructor]|uniref:Homocysteine s-methyltransferase domain-containing protein n=1 Tax=Ditylenchus destructor TaxID=166010 RepID=A0AAD4ML85_9BILA|nr:homocysteine s-methyltransferase domain-containing protein [Ditylenchus destructor]